MPCLVLVHTTNKAFKKYFGEIIPSTHAHTAAYGGIIRRGHEHPLCANRLHEGLAPGQRVLVRVVRTGVGRQP